MSCVGKAISYLEAHFDQPINLDDLSRLTHMSKRSFLRAFQTATGSTPIAYLVNCDSHALRRCSCSREESVTSVAFKVGFNDSNYFARRFHAMFEVPPSEYRNRQGLIKQHRPCPLAPLRSRKLVAATVGNEGQVYGILRDANLTPLKPLAIRV